MLENVTHRSISELAEAAKINRAYVCRLLDLTLLSPEITEAVLYGRQPKGMMLEEAARSLPPVGKNKEMPRAVWAHRVPRFDIK
jgi:hypothetical protein